MRQLLKASKAGGTSQSPFEPLKGGDRSQGRGLSSAEKEFYREEREALVDAQKQIAPDPKKFEAALEGIAAAFKPQTGSAGDPLTECGADLEMLLKPVGGNASLLSPEDRTLLEEIQVQRRKLMRVRLAARE